MMTSWTPVTDGRRGWLVVFGVCITNLSLLPLVQCFGLVFEARFRQLAITTTQTSLLLHLNSFICCALGLAGGPLLRRLTFRQVALLGCTVASLGVCLTSQSASVAGFVLTYCILLGVGQGILYPATSLALNSHFKRRRSFAMGLTIAATGLGPVLAPPAIAWLLEVHGVVGTVLLLGGVAMHSMVGALLLAPVLTRRSCEEAAGLQEKVEEVSPRGNSTKTANGVAVGSERDQEPEDSFTLIPRETEETGKPCPERKEGSDALGPQAVEETVKPCPERKEGSDALRALKKLCSDLATSLDLGLLRDPVFVNIVAGMSVSFVSELNFNMLTPFILAELARLPRASVATFMSIQGVADISARLLVPIAADTRSWSARSLYVISLAGSILGRSVLAHWHGNYHGLLALALLLGAAKGVKAVFQALVLPNYVTLEKLPAATGLLMVTNGVLSIVLGPFLGYVRDVSNSHVAALYVTSAMSLLCVLLWALEALLMSRQSCTRTHNSSSVIL